MRPRKPPKQPQSLSQRFAGKTAFITAAGQGIGRATAEAFVAEGGRVIATDLNAELLASLRSQFRTIKAFLPGILASGGGWSN